MHEDRTAILYQFYVSGEGMARCGQESSHRMTRDHIGFAVLLFFLLIAPKIPMYISGGSERSSISLGFVGFFVWFLLCPSYLLRFPRPPIPAIILLIFAFYTSVISLISTNTISIIYGVQFLFYITASIIFFRKYFLSARTANSTKIVSIIFFTTMIIFAAGTLISVFTGPIYPWLTIYTLRPWGDAWIQQGVGFGEAQNLTAGVLIIFVAAAIYLYQGDKFKKMALIMLASAALFSTLCRSPIFALFAAIAVLMSLDFAYMVFISGRANKKSILNHLYLILALAAILIGISLLLNFINRQLFEAVLSGFGFGNSGTLATDINTRLILWSSGINSWASSASFASVVLGNGFRSSMSIGSESGAWSTSHNFFVTILAEFGIIGLSILLLFFAASTMRDLHIIFAEKNEILFDNITSSDMARFRFVSLLAIMIHNLSGEFLYSPVLISMLVLVIISSPFYIQMRSAEMQPLGESP